MCPCGPDSGRIWPFSTPTGVCAERAPVSNFVKKKQVSSGSFVILSELQSLVVPFCEQMSQKGTGYPSREISGRSFFFMTCRPGRGTVWGLGVWGLGSKHGEGEWPDVRVHIRGEGNARKFVPRSKEHDIARFPTRAITVDTVADSWTQTPAVTRAICSARSTHCVSSCSGCRLNTSPMIRRTRSARAAEKPRFARHHSRC